MHSVLFCLFVCLFVCFVVVLPKCILFGQNNYFVGMVVFFFFCLFFFFFTDLGDLGGMDDFLFFFDQNFVLICKF